MKKTKDIKNMSVKELKNLSNQLFLCFFLTAFFAFLMHSFVLKIFLLFTSLLTFTFTIFLDKNIKRKKFDEEIYKKLEKKREVYKECIELLNMIETIFKERNYTDKEHSNDLHKFHTILCNCKSFEDYLSLKDILVEYFYNLSFQSYNKEEKETKDYSNNYNNEIKKYLNILGLSETITDINIIKKAYIKKIKETHPDVGGDELKAKELNNAYEFLKTYFQ